MAWHNAGMPLDTTGDGVISPKDALAVFSAINKGHAGEIADTDSFDAMIDVNGDNHLSPRDGLQVVRHLNDGAQGEDDALIQLRLEVTTRDNTDAVATLAPNQDFFLRVYATDISPEAEGVFTAYLDVEYDTNLADADGTIEYSSDFRDGRAGDVSVDGLLDEIGALDQTRPDDGSAEILVLSVPMRTESEEGTLNFTGNPADILPLHEILLFRDTNTILDEEIMFVDTSVSVQDPTGVRAVNDSFGGTEDTLLSRSAAEGLLANDVGTGLTAVLGTDPANGTLNLNSDGSFTYQPNANFSGADSFTYRANNGQNSNLATVELTIEPVNDAPVAANDSYETPGDTPLVRTNPSDGVLANDTDVENSELSVVLSQITGPSNGTLDMNANGGFVYTPNGGFSGVDSFTYLASDGESLSQLATVTVTVGSSASPESTNDSYVTLSGTTLNVPVAQSILLNDSDPNDLALTAVLFSSTSNGTLDLDDDGSFTYTPDADFFGVDSFRYFASNGTEVSATATVTIDVGDSNVAPEAVSDSYSVGEDMLLQVSVLDGILSNDTDADGDTLTATIIDGPANGTISNFLEDGRFNYQPNADFNGLDEFTYSVSDGRATDTGIVRIVIGAQEEAPMVVDDSYDVAFETTLIRSAAEGVLSNDSDVDGTLLTAQLIDGLGPANGTVVLELDGSFEYTPNDGFEGTDSFVYVVENGAVSRFGTVTLDVQVEETGPFVNIRLVATDLQGNEITTANVGDQFQLQVFAEDTSPEPQEGVFAAYADIEWNGALAIVSGPIEYSEDYPNGQRGNTSTSGLVDEAGAFYGENEFGSETELLLTVPMQASESGEITFSTNAADVLPFGDILLFDTVDSGLTEFVPSELIVYGSTSLTIAGNPVPIAAPDGYSTQGPLTISATEGVLTNDIGVENELLTATIDTQPTTGTVELNDDGSFTYVPALGFVGEDTFTYRAIAGNESSTATTVTIDVQNPDPSSVGGFVYFDTNNNGLRENEHAFGGVLVTLTGSTTFGDEVSLTTRTATNGSYRFNDLVEGNYTIRQEQPAVVIDGIDSQAGDVSAIDNAFMVDLGAAEDLSELNFGERGLKPGYFGSFMFMSNLSEGAGIAVGPDGSTSWYCTDAGWAGLRSLQASVSSDGRSVTVSAVDTTGQLVGGTFATANRNVYVLGNAANGYLVRLLGESSSFSMQPINAAVDAALV